MFSKLLGRLRQSRGIEASVPKALLTGEGLDGALAWKNLMAIAVPSVIEIVLSSLIGSVDTVMVGSLGKNALAAVALTVQPRMIMLSIFFAINVGITTIIARRKGERDQKGANDTMKNALMLVFSLSVLMFLISFFVADPLMRLAGANTSTDDDAQVLALSVSYFRIINLSLPFHSISMGINSALRGIGNTKVTLKVNMISNIINVIFNYLLIGGKMGFPRLGVDGAAIASVLGIVGASLFAIYSVVQNHNSFLHICRHSRWKIDPKTIKNILKVGGNAMIEQVSMRFGFFMYSRIIFSMGVLLFAAHNIVAQFFALTFSFADGISVASTSLVGQSLGEKRPDKAYMYGVISLRMVFLLSAILGVFIALFRYPLSAVFINKGTANAEEVIKIAAETLLVVIILQPFQMGSAVLSSCLRGAGDNLYVASVMMICVSVLRPIFTYIPVNILHFSLPLVWIVSLSEILIRVFLFGNRFRSLKWVNKKV